MTNMSIAMRSHEKKKSEVFFPAGFTHQINLRHYSASAFVLLRDNKETTPFKGLN